MLNRIVFVLVLTIFFSRTGKAQEVPAAEIAGVYSVIVGLGSHCNGGGGATSLNVNRWFGVVADVSGCRTRFQAFRETATNTRLTYLFGPRVSLRSDRFTPYAQVLAGGAHASSTLSPSGFQGSSFALSVGVGADLMLTPRLALKLAQPEYLRSKFSGVPQKDLRV